MTHSPDVGMDAVYEQAVYAWGSAGSRARLGRQGPARSCPYTRYMRSHRDPAPPVAAHRRLRTALWGLLALSGLLLLACGGGSVARGAVHVSELDNDIGPVTADFVDRALDRAEDNGAAVWILELSTPGGQVTATDDITERIIAARVPVVVYVSPAGARAASAGTFITMSGHVAVMAPSTQIGAATPINAGGEEIEGPLGEKIINDAVAGIQGIARLRQRNAEWAEAAVREAASVTAEEAVALGVVDFIARDLSELITKLDGRAVVLDGYVDDAAAGPETTIRTAGADVVRSDMNLFENILDVIADPNIAFLLLTLGGLALLIEIISPGLVGPGVVGVIMLIFAFFSLDVLDANVAGIVLVLLAFVLIAVEILVAGFGIFGIGGIVSLCLGGLLLVSDTPGGAGDVSIWLLIIVAAVIAAVVAVLWLVMVRDRAKARNLPTRLEGMVGRTAFVHHAIDPEGTVKVAAELWSARAPGGPIAQGVQVRVMALDGLTMIVEPLGADVPGAAPAAGAPPSPPPPPGPADS